MALSNGTLPAQIPHLTSESLRNLVLRGGKLRDFVSLIVNDLGFEDVITGEREGYGSASVYALVMRVLD